MDEEKNSYPVYAKIFNLYAIREDDTSEDPHRYVLEGLEKWLSPEEFQAFIEKNEEVIE